MSDSATELAHINEEIYKKSVELAEKNKVLSVIRSIDEIILSTVTDPKQISEQVAHLIIQAVGFMGVGVYLLNNNLLEQLTLNFSNDLLIPGNELISILDQKKFSYTQSDNLLIKTIQLYKHQYSPHLLEFLQPYADYNTAINLQSALRVQTIATYVLQARSEILGVLILFLHEEISQITAFHKEIMYRIADLIGIALDNAILYKKIQDANIKLKQLDKLKDEFVSLASHELRTPMTVVRSYLWMVMDTSIGQLNQKQKTYIDRAYGATVRLISMVNDMLNISRIESGRLSINIQKIDYLQLVKDTISEIKPRADELNIHVTLEERALPPVLADSDKIKEVLINLIGNSLKFTPAGGSITIRFEVGEDKVVTRITDTGNGITKENMEKLFQKFDLIESSYKTNKNSDTQGTGLGLYIVKSIVELHKGTISVFSEGEGKGSTFTFSLRTYNEKDYVEFTKLYESKKNGLGVIHSGIA